MGGGCSGGVPANKLFDAITSGSDSKVRVELRSITKNLTNSHNEHGDNPLHHAARVESGDKAMCVEALVTSANSIDFNALNTSGQTALHIAAEKGHVGAFRTILKAAAKDDIADPAGKLPLHLAAEHMHAACLAAAVSGGWSTLRPNSKGQIALHISAAVGDVAGVEELLKSKEKDQAITHQGGGQTPLHEAAAAGQKDVVEVLLKAGVDSQIKSQAGGKTPAQVAEANEHKALAIRLGASVKEEDIIAGKVAVAMGGGAYQEGDPEGLIPASDDTRRRVQELMDVTWKGVATRDRGFQRVSHFEVVQVLQNGKKSLWEAYAQHRRDVELHYVEKLEDVKTVTDSWEEYLEEKRMLSVNEFFLFHGTKPSAASAICETGFRIDLSGSNKGALYGPGVYCAESSSKADEYAMDDVDGLYKGLYAMLLCRVTLGNPYITTEVQPDLEEIARQLEADDKHCIIGDREAARGTFREFIVRSPDKVYPAYVIIYRRTEAVQKTEGA